MSSREFNILRESLDLVILKALTAGPLHGYGIAEWIENATGDVLYVGDGAVIGQRAAIDGRAYRIVGVLAPESELGPPVYSFNVRTAQYLVARQPGSTASQQVIVRMRPGVAPKAVASELADVLHAADARPAGRAGHPRRTRASGQR